MPEAGRLRRGHTMSTNGTHVEVVEDGDEFSVDLHDGEGEDRETFRVVTYATLAEADGLRELIAVWIRAEQDRYYAVGYEQGRRLHPLTQEERDARESATLTARIAELKAASGSTEPGQDGPVAEAGRLVVEISFGAAHHRIEGPMGLSPRGVEEIVKAVQAARDEHERLADGPVA